MIAMSLKIVIPLCLEIASNFVSRFESLFTRFHLWQQEHSSVDYMYSHIYFSVGIECESPLAHSVP